MKLWFNLMCSDVEAQFAFYRDVFGLPEAEAARSPIYRAVETKDFQFGFNDAAAAYRLLGLERREPTQGLPCSTVAYPTLMLESPTAVDAAVRLVPRCGGRVIKGPFATYYGQWQAVLTDPEDNVFRIATDRLPDGVVAPSLHGTETSR